MIVGCDCHKDTHAIALLDERGGSVGCITVPNSQEGYEQLIQWLIDHDAESAVVGVENGTGGYGRHLTAAMVAAGYKVLNVPGWRTARDRSRQGPGKSDPQDAIAIAEVVLRKPDKLTDSVSDELIDTITTLQVARSQAVNDRTAQVLRAKRLLCEIDPELEKNYGDFTSKKTLDRLAKFKCEPTRKGKAQQLCLRQLVTTIKQANKRISKLEEQLDSLLEESSNPFEDMPGVGPTLATALIAHTGDIRRFKNKAAYAKYAGTAPMPCGSGKTNHRHRLNPHGNRQLNADIHRIAITQTRCHPPAKEYVARKQAEGKTKREAIRSLKRHLTNTVYKHLKTWADQTLPPNQVLEGR